jgi:hypothetical protein
MELPGTLGERDITSLYGIIFFLYARGMTFLHGAPAPFIFHFRHLSHSGCIISKELFLLDSDIVIKVLCEMQQGAFFLFVNDIYPVRMITKED